MTEWDAEMAVTKKNMQVVERKVISKRWGRSGE